MIFDTHAHYDSGAFNADREELLASMPSKGVGLILDPGCEERSSRAALALAEKYPFVYAAVGVHPEDMEGMTSDTLETIRGAMSKVVDENAAVTAFDGFGVKVGGKTGSAQVTGQSSNAVFISFAPLDDPEIAVSCVLERGAHGANAAVGVRQFMEYYFGRGE